MKAIRRIGLVLVPSLLLIVYWQVSRTVREPEYQGKPISYWMMQTTSSALEGNSGLAAIGTNAVPFLARALGTKESFYAKCLRTLGPVLPAALHRVLPESMTTERAEKVRHKAAYSLLAFGPQAGAAWPYLLEATKDEDMGVRQIALNSIAQLGPRKETIPHLIAAWNNPDRPPEGVREYVVINLELAGALDPKAVIPTLVQALNDKAAAVRSRAAFALARVRQPVPEAVPRLTAMLSDSDKQCHYAAALALGRVATSAEAALPDLRRLQGDDDPYVRGSAALALWRFRGDSDSTIRTFLEILKTENGRVFAAECLGEMGSAAKTALPALWSFIHAPPGHTGYIDRMLPAVRLRAAEAILKINPPSPEAISAILQAMNDAPWLTSRGIITLGQLGSSAEAAIPTLEKALSETNENVRRVAAEALSKIAQARAGNGPNK